MKNLENEMDIIFLLDKSGSMYGSEKDTIGGFNSIIKEQKSDEVQAKVTTTLFDHEYEMLYKRKDLFDVDELTEKLKKDGYVIVSGPRTTGDGYYESCIVGIEGNQIEITV